MIIEVGTCDFDTNAGLLDGIYIEPVKYYFDRLPDCKKENVAISNFEGECKVFYLEEEDIIQINLSRKETNKIPEWLKGCSSIIEPHPTLLKYVDITQIRVGLAKVVKLKSIIEKYNITEIDYLKIDTEGHDCVILNNFLDECDILPHQIKFENNRLTNQEELNKIVKRLESLDYQIEFLVKDVVAKKNKIKNETI